MPKGRKNSSRTLGILVMLPFLILCGMRFYEGVMFNRNCGGHLKRAADANTVELATEELQIAVKYLDDNQLTSGYTSLLYNTPDEDVGFWHRNLTASLEELRNVHPDATQLEKSNLLLKLRQTLLDHTGNGENVTSPNGISVFPSNRSWFFAFMSFLALFCVGIYLIWKYSDDRF